METTSSANGLDNGELNLVHGPDSPLVDLIRDCSRIAAGDATVLITGETGTGKEVFARLIHERSRHAAHPLVPVNCAAIPKALLESELFGHVKGAFTGASSSRLGRMAAAEGGTLFLDEIGEFPVALQVKLLRVLQERCYEPVGSAESVPVNSRLIAATNRDLSAEVAADRFHRDLYDCLRVCPIEIPPLRARRGDVPALFSYFWNVRGDRRPVDPAVLHLLEAHEWPGNVRELENLVERLSVCTEGPAIRVCDLPAHLRSHAGATPECEPERLRAPPADPAGCSGFSLNGNPVNLPAMLRQIEEAYIDAALVRTHGNKKAAADLLGLQRTTLVEKLRRRQNPVVAVGFS